MDIMINKLLNSVMFWAAWIVIPLLLEILPALGTVFVLLKKRWSRTVKPRPIIYPEISLIIPVYNSAGTLRACIDSIDKSDYPNDKIRIFLVNNEGKDDSFSVFTKCQEEYPSLLMQWMNAKQGKSKALNMALFNSEGKYIVHIDSDGVLEKSALKNMVTMFEHDDSIECVTGAIMIDSRLVEKYDWFFPKLFRKLEYMEYAQAFLAGRNYSSELNTIYTLSGAFSAFKKSVVLKSQLYNTDTICEDTQITFQMERLQHKNVKICENAIFMVDPIDDFNKLYTQRQRWQRGSLEVSNLFLKDKMQVKRAVNDVGIRTLIFDHTLAFPRMIWYLAMVCLMCTNYSFNTIMGSLVLLSVIYGIIGFLYFFSTVGYLREFPELKKYYKKQWYIVFLLPLYNQVVFFIRFAGIINSIDTDSSWRTKNFRQEHDTFWGIVREDFKVIFDLFDKINSYVNSEKEYDETKQNGIQL